MVAATSKPDLDVELTPAKNLLSVPGSGMKEDVKHMRHSSEGRLTLDDGVLITGVNLSNQQ